jgi:hypothetical protein
MPEMVYAVCRLAGSKPYTRDEMQKLITLGSNHTSVFNDVFRFSVDCGYISERPDGTYDVNFTKEQLSSFREFRYAICREIFRGEGTMFTALMRWFLSRNAEILTIKSAEDLAIAVPKELFPGVEKDYMLGFRFWAVALGFCMLHIASHISALVFAANHALLDWLEYEQLFKKGATVLARDFFGALIKSCPAFADCIRGNDIGLSLSMGLRVLHIGGMIELRYTTDSGDIWHLTDSISHPQTNNITEIIVR